MASPIALKEHTPEAKKQEYYIIEGGASLKGDVQISGAKNAITKMLIASLLTDDICTLYNAPRIGDVSITEEVCKSIGSRIDREDDTTIKITTKNITENSIPEELGRLNRLCVLTIGPLLHRCGQAVIPQVGGDAIGARPINFHLDALREMGAKVSFKDGIYSISAKRLRGTTLQLPYPSVMTTENLIISATLAKGVTVIQNAAIEPEIIDLIKMLQKMGAIIEMKVDRKIVIEGVESLHGVKHRIIGDRNEAVSLAVAAYCTRGDVNVHGANQEHLLTFLNTIYKIGLDFEVENDYIRFIGTRGKPLNSIALETDVHPGFMTDWQQPFTVLLTQAKGMSVIHETVYEDRFGYTSELAKMGADIGLYTKCLGETNCRYKEREYLHSCIVRGPTPLHGSYVDIPDIRAGCSYIIAALTAKGTSVLRGIEHIERGYDHLDIKLKQLGAKITQVSELPSSLPSWPASK